MKQEVATLGGGCFWCLEAVFEETRGVLDVISGYAGGDIKQPTYEQVSKGNTHHAEVVQITFDPSVISYEEILKTGAAKPAFDAPFFQEFVVKLDKPVAEVNKELLKVKIIGGLDLGEYYPELAGHMLVCVTEKRTKAEIDALVAGLEALK